MKKLLALILILALVPVIAAAEDVDPITGTWYTVKSGGNYHGIKVMVFYPDGVMWDHFIYVENDKVQINSADMTLWKRDETGTVITDYRNTKQPVEFLGDNLIGVVDYENDSVIMYIRADDTNDVMLSTVTAGYDAYGLEVWKAYVIGKDLPAGNYIAKYDCSFGRLYVYSSEESYSKGISSSTTMIGETANKKDDYNLTFTDGQVIVVNKPGCTLYYVP